MYLSIPSTYAHDGEPKYYFLFNYISLDEAKEWELCYFRDKSKLHTVPTRNLQRLLEEHVDADVVQ